MTQKKIELYKTRDFGAKINATIEYVRYNFGPLIKIVLLIVAPVGLLVSILFSNLFGTIFSMSANPAMSDAEAFGKLGAMGSNYLIVMVLVLVTYSIMMSCIYTYIKMRDNMEDPPEVMEVLRAGFPKVPGLIGLMLLITVVSFVGLFFFVIPGIYLAITLSIAVPIYVYESRSVGDAFGKSFKLIRGKWWSTFGLLFVAGMIASMVSYVFAIPMYAMMFSQLFSNVSEANPDPEAVFEIFSSWYTTAGMAIMMIGSYTTYLIPMIALSFQYFNLSERVEGTGIRNQIEGFEKLS